MTTPATRTPNDEQLAVVNIDHIQHPRLLVCAGAGSGKTATIIWRLNHEAQNSLDGHLTYVMTFTNVAARQLQERLAALDITVAHVGTLHSFAIHQIRQHGVRLGYDGWPTLHDEERADYLIKQAADRLNIKGVALSAVREAFGAPPTTKAALVAKAYRAECRQNNVICYDLMLAELELLIDMGWIASPDTLIVDEFQDSGNRDARIYDKLKARFDLRVGDFDQSMYSFRGGNIRHIQAFAKRACVKHLSTNYRSHAMLVEKSNNLIAGAPGNPYRQRMSAVLSTGNVTYMVQDFDNPIDEVSAIYRAITTSGFRHSECAVLCRYNERAKSIREGLAQRGITVARQASIPRPARLIAALRAVQLRKPKNEDQACSEWLKSVDQRQVGSKEPPATVSEELRRLGVIPTMPIGAALKRMGFDDEACWLVNANWQGCPETTADALELIEEQSVCEGVHVGTVHSFKGAEAEMVWLAGWEQQTIPATKKGDSLDEERRIAYVAQTRAKRFLYLSWCRLAPDSTGFKMQPATASQFITNE